MKTQGLYSNFFSSGLFSIKQPTRNRPTSMFAFPTGSGLKPFDDTSSSSQPASQPSATQSSKSTSSAPPYIRKHRHHSSFHFTMSSTASTSNSQATTNSPPTASPRSRRSSLLSFPGKMINRMSASFPIEPRSPRRSTSSSSRPQTSSGLRHEQATEITDVVWITEGGPIVSSKLLETSPKLHPLDPFASSPDTKSVFIDFSDTDTPVSTPNRESFISFSTSSKSSSLLHLPRRERPTSVQTMPLPPRSRRSSLQYPPPAQEKYDWAWMLDETTPIFTQKAGEELEQVEEADEIDPAQLDWRQFHIDLLQGDVAA
ncbi:hypothetical protein CCMSSC00406_0007435 [Pleurotus cornucopiae]|uniref:Uncharacterized protein n=1 Tax=Pleurotus cornucopiae TaxID=5321 RepID=A0ACB7J525_PLECO|nr:hypothetical protein CCMSSC00406_0007435 [Pleurotus cornucopiae]